MSPGMRPGAQLCLLLCACSGAEETLRIALPERTAAGVSRLTVTVLDPTSAADSGVPYASCGELGAFGPIRRLAGGATQPDAAAVLRRFEAALPVEEADLSLPALRATEDNPWGVVAVLVEGLGPVVDGGSYEVSPEFEEAPILQSCYCGRTLGGRHQDPELDRRVKQDCPFIGGAEGTQPAERRLTMSGVMPEEFVLEPCGTASDVLIEGTPDQRGLSACLRTRLCEDVNAGSLCFDCPAPCERVADLSGAVVAYEVILGELQPSLQFVRSNADGEVWPVFATEGCAAGEGATVEAFVPGRRAGAVRFDVRCVAGRTVELLAAVEQTGPPPRVPALAVDATDPQWVVVGGEDRLQTWRRAGDSFEPGPEQVLEGAVEPLFIFGESRAGGTELAVLGHDPEDGHALRAPRYHWTREGLALTQPGDQGPCQTCTCGSRSCADGEACEEGEQCVEGACRPATCPCTYRASPLEFRAGAGDFDGDGVLDLLVADRFSRGSTSAYGGPGGITEACRCDLSAFGASPFVIGDLNVDGLDDTIWIRSEGPALRLAQDRSTFCASARAIGRVLDVPKVATARLRCELESCPGHDLVTVDGDGRGRVLFADPAIEATEANRFERRDTHARFLLPGDRGSAGLIRRHDGDVNGDGLPDLALIYRASPSAGVDLFLGDGRGNLAAFPRRLQGSDFGCAEAEDLAIVTSDTDGDGVSEAIVRCRDRILLVRLR